MKTMFNKELLLMITLTVRTKPYHRYDNGYVQGLLEHKSDFLLYVEERRILQLWK